MTLGTDVDAALPYFRAQAESRMSETVQVTTTEKQDTGGFDPEQVPTTHYSGRARVKFASQVVSDREVAGQFPVVQSVELHLPSGTVVPRGSVAEVTASTADSSLVGRRFTVTGLPQAGQTTAARYPVEVVS